MRNSFYFKLIFLLTDSINKVSQDSAQILLSETLLAMKYFQILWPTCFIQASYDLWKILPKNEDEKQFYISSSQQSMLEILLAATLHNVKGQVCHE